jgi:heterodisulfide reductase subunit A
MSDKIQTKDIRIGVYVCRWGVNIGAWVDCDALKEFAEPLPNVTIARVNDFTGSDPGHQIIKNYIL